MNLYWQKSVSRAVCAFIRLTFIDSCVFSMSEIPLCNPNLHIKIILYCYWLIVTSSEININTFADGKDKLQ